MVTLSSYNDILIFSKIPPPAEVGKHATFPFELTLYSGNTSEHIVDLYSQNSTSRPWQIPQNKWSHLIPQWRFIDLSGNQIDKIKTIDTISYDSCGVPSVTGIAEFYYIDDRPVYGCNPLLIWATLNVSAYPFSIDSGLCKDLPSYANSKVFTVTPYYINGLAPSYLRVDRNGIDPMFDLYWKKTHIPEVVTVRGSSPAANFCPEIGLFDPILFDIPSSNAVGVSGGPVIRSLIDISSSDQTWDPTNIDSYLSAYDSNSFIIGGFLRSNVVSNVTASQTSITASVSTIFGKIPSHTVFAWVANPENNVIHNLYIPCVPETTVAQITSFIEVEKTKGIGGNSTNVYMTPPITSVFGMTLSGFSGVYGIAVDPCYNVWMTDSEKDCLYKFTSLGNLVSTINFEEGVTPAGISLDGVGNMWISLFDSLSVLKFNTLSGNLLTAIDIGEFIPVGDPYAGFYTDSGPKPTLAETDSLNNIWVSYTNTLCSMLMKFDSFGNYLCTVNLPACSNPMDILVDYSDNIWLTLTRHAGPPYLLGEVRKYTSTGSLLSTVSAVHPEYLTMDIHGTVWYTSDFNTVTYITSAGSSSSFTVGSSTLPEWSSSEQLVFNCLEGIAADSFGKVLVINSLENNVYIYDEGVFKTTIHLVPDSNNIWYNDEGYQTVSASNWAKSAQAYGDWTGWRWRIKYTESLTPFATETKYITGESNKFDIKDFTGLNIRRFNESFNPTDQIKSYVFPAHIHDNPVFWDGLVGAAWGGNEIGKPSFGREAYEKIANFVANHDDIDAANVAQLYSLSHELDVPIDDYNLEFPPDLKRIMDIVSVNQQTLWGGRCVCNLNIQNLYETVLSGIQVVPVARYCPRCGHYHPGNRGPLFDATTYVVTAWEPFIVKDNWQGGTYTYVLPSPSCNDANTACLTAYPLSSHYMTVLPTIFTADVSDWETVSQRFCYSSYVSGYCGTQIAGIISWDDIFTTLDEHVSGIYDWYGDNELVETMLNYTLHKGLGLIED
jgi:streptogramin lyase